MSTEQTAASRPVEGMVMSLACLAIGHDWQIIKSEEPYQMVQRLEGKPGRLGIDEDTMLFDRVCLRCCKRDNQIESAECDYRIRKQTEADRIALAKSICQITET